MLIGLSDLNSFTSPIMLCEIKSGALPVSAIHSMSMVGSNLLLLAGQPTDNPGATQRVQPNSVLSPEFARRGRPLMHSFDRRAKHSRGCNCIPNILTVLLGLVPNREFLTKNARLNLDSTPVRVFDRRRNIVTLRSVRKPNRRQSKVHGACTLVVIDRHFLPEGESIGLERRTCDERAQETNGGRKRRFGFPSARGLTSPGALAALGALGAGLLPLLFFLVFFFFSPLDPLPLPVAGAEGWPL